MLTVGHCEWTERVSVIEWEGLGEGFRRKRQFLLKSEKEARTSRDGVGV